MNKASLSIQMYPAFAGANRYDRPFANLDPKRQAMVLLDTFGDAHKDRNKKVGFRTKKARAYFLMKFIEYLKNKGMLIRSLLNVDQRHLACFIAVLRDRQLAPATFQCDISNLRWMLMVLGKDGALQPMEHYAVPASQTKRVYVTNVDRSWSIHESLTEELIQKAMDLDETVGIYMLLMLNFGLRVTEAVLLKPTKAQVDGLLYVDEGAKGGRARAVPVRTPQQIAVLRLAVALAMRTKNKSLIPDGGSVDSQRQRLYYVCRKIGATRKALGLTPHGLRHEYANNRYEDVAGVPSRVRRGPQPGRAEDTEAREVVSAELGHARIQITSAYVGSRRGRGKSDEVRSSSDEFPALYPVDQIPGLDALALDAK